MLGVTLWGLQLTGYRLANHQWGNLSALSGISELRVLSDRSYGQAGTRSYHPLTA
jgi:hypothetical protein